MEVADVVRVKTSLTGIYEGEILEFRGRNTLVRVNGIVSIDECDLV